MTDFLEDLRDELKNYGIVTLVFKSGDEGREFVFNTINLDEVNAAPQAPQTDETRKPQVAGATD